MAVRHFDGVDDIITLTPVSPNFIGAGSMAIVWRADTNRNNGLWSAEAAGFQRWGYITVNDGHHYWTVGGFVDSGTYSPDEWYLTVLTKPTGSPETVRSHVMPFSTGTWSHTDVGTVNDGSASQDAMHFGLEVSTGFRLLGDLAAAALWVGTVLSDAECESLESGVSDWLALTPEGLWVLNQESTSDPVLDLTGNGWDQTAITGTTVVTGDDPPGFDLTTGPNEGTVDFPVALSLATTASRASQGQAGYTVALGLATAGSRPSLGQAAWTMAVSLGTAGARAASGVAAWAVSLALGTRGADPDAVDVRPPPLDATGSHPTTLTAPGEHDRSLVASGEHPL